MSNYHYTVDWFSPNIPVWKQLLDQTNPAKIIEIGSFEGRSACFLIEYLSQKYNLEIHCVDTWEGGIEHKDGGAAPQKMSEIEGRFHHNINFAKSHAPNAVQIVIHKGYSDTLLPKIITSGFSNYFDLAYIDGSHQAPDVLADAISCFKLLRVGGLMFFDDYLWKEVLPGGTDLLRCPKPAIDAFTNIFARKIEILRAPLDQLYLQKISD